MYKASKLKNGNINIIKTNPKYKYIIPKNALIHIYLYEYITTSNPIKSRNHKIK